MTGYCLKCRESREMQEAEQVTMKNGRPATRGKCGECGTTMFRIGKASLRLCKAQQKLDYEAPNISRHRLHGLLATRTLLPLL